jgi:tetratricopeptide (TPR) repeat protein
MKKYKLISLAMVLLLSGCVMLGSPNKQNVQETELKENQARTIEEFLTGAEKLFEEGQFRDALGIYQKILTLDTENQTSLFRIQEINKLLQTMEEQEKSYKNALKTIRKKQSEKLNLFKKEYKKLEADFSQGKESQRQLAEKAKISQSLYEAGIALAEHDFEKARKLTRKVLMILPDSKDASFLWAKIAKAEEEWRIIEKIKEAEKEQSQKIKILRSKPSSKEKPASSKKDKSVPGTGTAEKQQNPSNQGEKKSDDENLDDRIKRQSEGDMESILKRQMLFSNLPVALERPVKADFLQDQSLIVFRKIISEYEKDVREGTLQNFNDKDLAHYREGVAEAYFTTGKYFEDKKKPEEALPYFSAIPVQFQDSRFLPYAYFHLGMLYLVKKDNKKAYELFEKVIDLSPLPPDEEEDSNRNSLPALKEIQLEAYKKMGRINRGEKKFQAALTLYRGLREKPHQEASIADEMDILIADTQMELAKPDIAYTLYTSLINKGVKCKQYEKARFNRTQALIQLGRFLEARSELEDIMNGDPLNAYKIEAPYRYGQTYYAEGNYSKTIVLLQKALNESPQFAEKAPYLMILAGAYARSSLSDSALAVYSEIMDKYSDSLLIPEALYESARLLFDRSRYDEAKELLSSLDRTFPDTPFAREGKYLLGDIYMSQEKYDAAEKQYHAAYLDNAEGLSAFISKYKRIQCLRKLEKFSLLLKYFSDLIPSMDKMKESILAMPENERSPYLKYFYKILFEYGDLLMSLKKYPEAIPVYRRVVEEHPSGEDSPWSTYLIGKCYELSGEKEKAIAQFQSILEKGGEGFWVDQARFDCNNLVWNRQFQKQAMQVGGKYPEGAGN